MKISAVVATYNREKFLPAAIEGLRIQTLASDLFEIIIVNNNSKDSTKSISETFIKNNPQLNITYCEEFQQGLSFGRNRGIIESKTPLITFIDDDAVVQDDFLEKAVNYLDEHKEAEAVGGKIFANYLNKKPIWMSKYIHALVGHVDYGDTSFEYPSGKYPYGSNMTIRKTSLIAAGMFNTKLGRIGAGGLGGEEKEMFDKINRSGGKIIYVPSLVVYHSVDDERLTKPVIRKLSIGVGGSERLRMIEKGIFHFIKKIIEYKIKFLASCLLAFLFLLKGNPAAGYYLLFVRWHATMGLVFKNAK